MFLGLGFRGFRVQGFSSPEGAVHSWQHPSCTATCLYYFPQINVGRLQFQTIST